MKHFNFAFFLFIIFITHHNYFFAQTVKGYVYDLMNWQDKNPIENASIKFSNSKGEVSTTSDAWGYYELNIEDLITGIEQPGATNTRSLVRFYGKNNQLTISGMDVDRVTITDVLGQEKPIGNSANVNLSNLSPQFYRIKAENETETYQGFFMLTDDGTVNPKTMFVYENKRTSEVITPKRINKQETSTDDIMDVEIISEKTYPRETKIKVDTQGDTEHDFYPVSVEEFPDSLMDFFNIVSHRNIPRDNYATIRRTQPLQIYIKADTTDEYENHWANLIIDKLTGEELNEVYKSPLHPEGFLKGIDERIEVGTESFENNETPGYFYIYTQEILVDGEYAPGILALTGSLKNEYGEIIAAHTKYNINLQDNEIDRTITKEFAVEFPGRSQDRESMLNYATRQATKDWQIPDDRKMNLLTMSRAPGNVYPDKDNGWDFENNAPLIPNNPSANGMLTETMTIHYVDGRTETTCKSLRLP